MWRLAAGAAVVKGDFRREWPKASISAAGDPSVVQGSRPESSNPQKDGVDSVLSRLQGPSSELWGAWQTVVISTAAVGFGVTQTPGRLLRAEDHTPLEASPQVLV